jgi:hypothetical protein
MIEHKYKSTLSRIDIAFNSARGFLYEFGLNSPVLSMRCGRPIHLVFEECKHGNVILLAPYSNRLPWGASWGHTIFVVCDLTKGI